MKLSGMLATYTGYANNIIGLGTSASAYLPLRHHFKSSSSIYPTVNTSMLFIRFICHNPCSEHGLQSWSASMARQQSRRTTTRTSSARWLSRARSSGCSPLGTSRIGLGGNSGWCVLNSSHIFSSSLCACQSRRVHGQTIGVDQCFEAIFAEGIRRLTTLGELRPSPPCSGSVQE